MTEAVVPQPRLLISCRSGRGGTQVAIVWHFNLDRSCSKR